MEIAHEKIHADAREATARQIYKAIKNQSHHNIAIAIILQGLDDWYEKGKIHKEQEQVKHQKFMNP